MEIVKRQVTDLKMAAYNPRKDLKPGDTEYEKLKKSIMEFDYIDPVIWNKRSGNVVGGHQRLKVLIELGHKEIDVSVVDLDEQREKALNIALNKMGEGSWDFQKLSMLLTDIDHSELDLDLTGFDDNSFKRVVARTDEKVLQGQISTEEEYLQAQDLADKIIKQVTSHIEHIAKTSPQDLNSAVMVVVNKGIGNNVIFMADPCTKDIVSELKRYSLSGERSPLEMLTGAIWK